MTTHTGAQAHSPGEACPKRIPNLSRALVTVESCACLLEVAVRGWGEDAASPERMDIIRRCLRDALDDLGAPCPRFPTAADIEGATIDTADEFFGPYADTAPPVSWGIAKDLVRAGIVAGMRLAGGGT